MKIGIIGCGTIAAVYFRALDRTEDLFEIAALYDVSREKAAALARPGVRVCGSLEELTDLSGVEAVIISTPLHTHTEIAAKCLRKKKHVLLEKPAALDVAQIRGLFDLAEQMGVTFHVAFHSSFGVDIDWYLDNLAGASGAFSRENIRSLECGFYDPYVSGGVMQEDRKSLGGSYIDSGVNMLSVCDRLVPMENLMLRSHRACQTEDGVVYSSETVCADDRVEITMRTGWDLGLNQKRTLMRFNGTQDALLLDHTDQSVWRMAPDGGKALLFRASDGERLANQYISVFRVFSRALTAGTPADHRSHVLKIHELLLCVGEAGLGASSRP